MRTRIKILSVLIMLLIGASFAPREASAQGGYVSMQVFYDELSPYGTWVFSHDYGYVWIPDAGPNFSPYSSNGYWVFTNDGWTWVSNYSWGWAPFHYGRWYYDPYYGNVWVPDDVWGPAWVTWRRSGDYYGWAPIGPGVSITFAYSNDYYVPNNQWTFVSDRDFGRTNINNYYVDNSTNVTIINNSTVINNTYVDKSSNVTYNAGPDRAEVEKKMGRPITTVAIKESKKPGQTVSNDQLQIYKPQVKKNISTGGKNPAPAAVKNFEDVKPAVRKTNGTQHLKETQRQVEQPAKQQLPKQQQTDQPGKQQFDQPAKQQPADPKSSGTQKSGQPKKTDKTKQPKQPKTSTNPDPENQPHYF